MLKIGVGQKWPTPMYVNFFNAHLYYKKEVKMTGEQNIADRNPNVVADELDALQASKNEGRGVSCVRTMVMYLRMGNITSAIAVRMIEGDKTRSYPDIEKYLNEVFGCRLHGKINCEGDLCQSIEGRYT